MSNNESLARRAAANNLTDEQLLELKQERNRRKRKNRSRRDISTAELNARRQTRKHVRRGRIALHHKLKQEAAAAAPVAAE